MSQKLFNKSLIIGLGLIGGSFAKALKEHNLSDEIYACDKNKNSLTKAKDENIIISDINLRDDLSEFDLIVIATPISSYEEIFKIIKQSINKNSLIIDLGSVKNFNIKNLPNNFIPCHPIAGSQNDGFDNSDPNLFANKKFFFCQKNIPQKLTDLIKNIKADGQYIDAKTHDKIYGLISHLPQFLSFLSKEFSPQNINDDFLDDCFRLDNSNPEIWGDIFNHNADNIEISYLDFFDNLEENFAISSTELLAKINNYPIINNIETKSDKIYIEDNFDKIFFRIILVISYLEILDLKKYQEYLGTGFLSFSKIINIAKIFNEDEILQLIAKNQNKITKIFNSLK